MANVIITYLPTHPPTYLLQPTYLPTHPPTYLLCTIYYYLPTHLPTHPSTYLLTTTYLHAHLPINYYLHIYPPPHILITHYNLPNQPPPPAYLCT